MRSMKTITVNGVTFMVTDDEARERNIIGVDAEELIELKAAGRLITDAYYLIIKSDEQGVASGFNKGDLFHATGSNSFDWEMNLIDTAHAGSANIQSIDGTLLDQLAHNGQLSVGNYYILTNDYDSRYFNYGHEGDLYKAVGVSELEFVARFATPRISICPVNSSELDHLSSNSILDTTTTYLLTEDYEGLAGTFPAGVILKAKEDRVTAIEVLFLGGGGAGAIFGYGEPNNDTEGELGTFYFDKSMRELYLCYDFGAYREKYWEKISVDEDKIVQKVLAALPNAEEVQF